MRRIAFVLLALLLAIPALASEPNGYAMDVDVSSTSQSDVFLCTVTVTNLEDGTLVFAPRVELRSGEPVIAQSKDGDLLSELAVSVDSATARVTTEVKLTRDGKVIAIHRSSVVAR
ncbi:MAG TPA: hypothetical protein VMQ61_16570 [Thermoanaerobaculia bacterium]|nr:hypothetical protein [Thermoanaerobaculia bacterium]